MTPGTIRRIHPTQDCHAAMAMSFRRPGFRAAGTRPAERDIEIGKLNR